MSRPELIVVLHRRGEANRQLSARGLGIAAIGLAGLVAATGFVGGWFVHAALLEPVEVPSTASAPVESPSVTEPPAEALAEPVVDEPVVDELVAGSADQEETTIAEVQEELAPEPATPAVDMEAIAADVARGRRRRRPRPVASPRTMFAAQHAEEPPASMIEPEPDDPPTPPPTSPTPAPSVEPPPEVE